MRALHCQLAANGLAQFLIMASSFAASALQIEFLDIGDPSIDGQVEMNPEELESVDRAAALWEDVFADDITVAITVAMTLNESASLEFPTALPSGQASSAVVTYQMETVRQHLIREANAGFELGEAFVHRQLGDFFTSHVPSFPTDEPIIADHLRDDLTATPPGLLVECPLHDLPEQPTVAWQLLRLTSANAKALGLSTGPDANVENSSLPLPSFDAHIALNIRIPSDGSVGREDLGDFLDFNQGDGVDVRKQDFTAVVAHEIGHALGYVTGSDNVTVSRAACEDDPALIPQPFLMDLWRFRPNGPSHVIAGEPRQYGYGPAEFFVRDRLPSPELARGLNTGGAAPDEQCGLEQSSHWRCGETENSRPLLMMATPPLGRQPTEIDITVLDYLGYERPSATTRILEDHPFIVVFDGRLRSFLENRSTRQERRTTSAIRAKADKSRASKAAQYAIRGELTLGSKARRKVALAGKLQFQPAKRNPNYSADRNRILRERWKKPVRVIDRIHLDHRPALSLPVKMLPPRLTGLELESNDKAEPRIRLTAVLPEHGIPINPRIGDHGGFELGFTVDGGNDRKRGDADATVTLQVKAAKEFDPSRGLHDVSWLVEAPHSGARMKIVDFTAFGLTPPDSDRDGVQDFEDNCPIKANAKQSDKNRNGIGDVCDNES